MMDKATELAHRIIPAAESEWPLTKEGRAIALAHAADIIRAALAERKEECARMADECHRQDEIDNGVAATGAAAKAAAAIRELK